MSDELTGALAQSALRSMDKIVIAIHGVGNQQRNETVRRVTSLFSLRVKPPLALMPLGFFHVDDVGNVRVSALEGLPSGDPLARLGFAEVFWSDIAKKVESRNDTLEEIKDWGRTVVSRAAAVNRQASPGNLARQTKNEFLRSEAVVAEIVETVAVLENLLFLAEKIGIFKFDLAPVLRDYVGDVQLVADFKFFRDRIVYRFHKAMHDVAKASYGQPVAERPELFVIAHSEGTVVSFMAMLEALSSSPGGNIVDPDDPGNVDKFACTDWIESVRGYMTIGSPIDKHLVLWPNMWKGLAPTRRQMRAPIQWRNYYDYGDPIGFKLDTAVNFLANKNCTAFAFSSDSKTDDFGFSRYWFPGKAHVDYWGDEAVFNHFIDGVILNKPATSLAPPRDRFLRGFFSTAMPYLISAIVHLAAVFVLFKAVSGLYVDPGDIPQAFRYFTRAVFCLGALLIGVTVAARVPRLVNIRWRWRWAACVFFVLMASLCHQFLPTQVALFFGDNLVSLWPQSDQVMLGKNELVAVAALIASTGWWLKREWTAGRRTLIGVGATLIFVMVALEIYRASVGSPVAMWPVVLAAIAFLYLWWLGILIFDLSFVWHRYIRYSVAQQALNRWYAVKPVEST